jgi:hypothetical protein
MLQAQKKLDKIRIKKLRRKTYSISTTRGQCVNLQHSIIRRNRLEGDIRVPSIGSKLAWLSQWVNYLSSTLLLLD